MGHAIRHNKGARMHDPRDVVSLGVGALTAGVGLTGLTMEDVQLILSIGASASGIVLAIATLWWRRGEHRRRVKDFKEYEKRIMKIEDDIRRDNQNED